MNIDAIPSESFAVRSSLRRCRLLPSPWWGGAERSDGEGCSSRHRNNNLVGRLSTAKDPSLLLRSLPPHKGEGKAASERFHEQWSSL
jgi:hypothetical protein